MIRVDLPPGPCSSVEQWFLYEDYHYPGAQGDSFTVEPASPADGSLEGFLAAQYAVPASTFAACSSAISRASAANGASRGGWPTR